MEWTEVPAFLDSNAFITGFKERNRFSSRRALTNGDQGSIQPRALYGSKRYGCYSALSIRTTSLAPTKLPGGETARNHDMGAERADGVSIAVTGQEKESDCYGNDPGRWKQGITLHPCEEKDKSSRNDTDRLCLPAPV
jgi:hypothetical protein